MMVGTAALGILLVALAQDSPPADRAVNPSITVDPAAPDFVPLHPRTAADRDRIEALRLFAAARALEGPGHRQWDEAARLLDEALKKAPDSPAILRQLALLEYPRGR